MVFGRVKFGRREEKVVEDVESFLEKLEDVLPIDEEENALIETVRWLALVEKTLEVTEKKMSLDEKIDTMAILEFLANREVEMLYRSSVREIAKLLLDAGENPYNIRDRKIMKKVQSLAFLTNRLPDQVLGDIAVEMKRLQNKRRERK